jgi:hypothetical protein
MTERRMIQTITMDRANKRISFTVEGDSEPKIETFETEAEVLDRYDALVGEDERFKVAIAANPTPTEGEIEAARSPNGGWKRATLAEWGVPWPPPRGWRQALIVKAQRARGLKVHLLGGMICHETITAERILEASQRRTSSLDNPGFCLACGAEADGCEPDARNHHCDACGALQVFGAEDLLLRVMI